jgi:ribonuclease HII
VKHPLWRDVISVSPKNTVRTQKKIDEEKWRQKLMCAEVIGVDEVGRGCLAGPVVSCAFVFKRNLLKKQKLALNDSKKLSKEQRRQLFPRLTEHYYSLGMASAQEIDELNILQATFLSMRRALENLTKSWPHLEERFQESLLFIDGSFRVPNVEIPNHYAVVGGDQWVGSISAASIIAKVTRDEMMEKLDEKVPGYFFTQHKGYGTKIHREALAKNGFSVEHRRSFKSLPLEDIC